MGIIQDIRRELAAKEVGQALVDLVADELSRSPGVNSVQADGSQTVIALNGWFTVTLRSYNGLRFKVRSHPGNWHAAETGNTARNDYQEDMDRIRKLVCESINEVIGRVFGSVDETGTPDAVND